MRVRSLLQAALACGVAAAHAQGAGDFAWRQHPGAPVPMQAALRDEAGRMVTLASLAGHGPLVLDFGYFHCPSLCGVVRSGFFTALAQAGLSPSRDMSFVSLSIDPAERPADAATARSADLAQAGLGPEGVFYLTGDAGPIETAVGFRARYDAQFKQFMHPAGLVVLTPAGTISSYLLGASPTGAVLRQAVQEAAAGGIAPPASPILLLCFHYDSTTGRYTLAVEKVLRIGAGLTVLALGTTLVRLHRRRWSG